jgi:hypothetical protein
VNGAGSVVLHPTPSAIRVWVQFYSHGSTPKLALERLKTRREAMADQVRTMKADKDSISFGSPSVAKAGPGGMPAYAVPTPALPAESYPVPPPSTYEPATPYVPGPPLTPVPVPAPAPAPSEPPSLPSVPTPPPEATPAPSLPRTSVPSTARRPVVADTEATPPAGAEAKPAPSGELRPVPPSPSIPPAPTYAPPITAPVAPPGLQPTPRPPRSSAQELYVAVVTLTAQWTLKAETAEDALVAGEAIRKKVQAVFGDAKLTEKLSPEEQELLEESRGSGPAPIWVPATPGPTFAPPTTASAVPVMPSFNANFMYVAELSAQQRKAALAEAFAKAKAQAAEIAEATGTKLGRIESVNGEISGARVPNNGPYAQMQPGPLMPPGGNENDSEATAADPAGLEIHVRISAQFRLQ